MTSILLLLFWSATSQQGAQSNPNDDSQVAASRLGSKPGAEGLGQSPQKSLADAPSDGERRALARDRYDLEITGGVNMTPYRSALESMDPKGVFGQSSRMGPSGSVSLIRHFGESQSQGVFLEVGYDNTNTVLHSTNRGYQVGWTMHRVTTDLGYEYRFFPHHRLRPFVRVGYGAQTIVSGEAVNSDGTNGGTAGVDCRAEKFAAVGAEYNMSKHISIVTLVEARFYRSSDFADVTWSPRSTITTEPKIGVAFHF